MGGPRAGLLMTTRISKAPESLGLSFGDEHGLRATLRSGGSV
jgi:hypothetical protein